MIPEEGDTFYMPLWVGFHGCRIVWKCVGLHMLALLASLYVDWKSQHYKSTVCYYSCCCWFLRHAVPKKRGTVFVKTEIQGEIILFQCPPPTFVRAWRLAFQAKGRSSAGWYPHFYFPLKNIEMHTKIRKIIFKLAQSSTLQRMFFRIIRMVGAISDKALAGTEPAEMEHWSSPSHGWLGTTKTINKNPRVQ